MGEDLEALRRHLVGVAYRVLGTVGESEDAVQEAFVRYAAADRAAIVEPRAWLTTTTARICLDVLRSARVRREAYVGPWLPEPLVERLPAADDPADEATRREDLSLALLVVLETLTPEQRVAFVLHDVFAVPFDEVADVLHTSAEAARQLASRARRAVADGRVRHTASRDEQRRVLAAFLDAVAGGDLDRMVESAGPGRVRRRGRRRRRTGRAAPDRRRGAGGAVPGRPLPAGGQARPGGERVRARQRRHRGVPAVTGPSW